MGAGAAGVLRTTGAFTGVFPGVLLSRSFSFLIRSRSFSRSRATASTYPLTSSVTAGSSREEEDKVKALKARRESDVGERETGKGRSVGRGVATLRGSGDIVLRLRLGEAGIEERGGALAADIGTGSAWEEPFCNRLRGT